MYEKQNCSQRLINHPWHVGPGANRRFLFVMVEQAHRALTHHRTDGSRPDMPTAQYNTQGMPQTKPPLEGRGGWDFRHAVRLKNQLTVAGRREKKGAGQEQSPWELCPIGSSRHEQWKCMSPKVPSRPYNP